MSFSSAAQIIPPESMDTDLKKPKPTGLFLSKTILVLALIIALLICILIGIACYFGGVAKNLGSTKAQTDPTTNRPITESTTAIGQTTSSEKPEPTAEELRLPRSLKPIRYDLRIKTYLPANQATIYDRENDEFAFDGELKIVFECKESVSTVTLNSNFINITENSAEIRDHIENTMIKVVRIEIKKELEMVVFHLDQDQKLMAGRNYTLSMSYRGSISDKLNGFYRSHYMEDGKKKWLGATQFQPVAARKAFPSFDEPDFKAIFGITIEHPSQYKAISNAMNVSWIEKQEGWTETKFGDSPKMSSYLVAWAISEFEFKEKRTSRGTLFRIWSRPSLLHQTDYAADVGPKCLEFYEDYYNIKYPLEKQDMIALPDFKSGAMENWGLITYREKYLLFDESVASLSNKQTVAVVVAHELAHQWFGNLVTTRWWDDLWLNEGFASLMEYYGTENATDGAFDIITQHVRSDLQAAMRKDELASSHPMLTYIGKAYDVYDIFDTISYQKGSTVIKMVLEVMGKDAFQAGLTNYLNKYSYDTADHNDLWNSLSKTAVRTDWNGNPINITEFADPWTVQMGYPLVTVTRNYSTGAVSLSQNRFKLDPNALEKKEYRNPPYNYKWHIPIWYKTENDPNSTNFDWLTMDKNRTLAMYVDPSQWIILNAGVRAYFRTQYDEKTWQQLSELLLSRHEVISVQSRSQLIDDAFTLAKAGNLSYLTAINLTKYLENEEHYVPWATATGHLAGLVSRFRRTESYGNLKKYMLRITAPTYAKYGWNYTAPSTDVLKQRLQSSVISDACAYGDPGCLEKAQEYFKNITYSCGSDESKLSGSCNVISPHLRYSVYCNSIKNGDITHWQFVWDKYLIENIAVEKSRLGAALACTKQPWILTRLLNEALDGKNIRHQDTTSMFYYVATNSVGELMIWSYFSKNWDRIVNTFSASVSQVNRIINYSTGGMDSEFDITQLDHFLDIHSNTRNYAVFKERKELIKIKADWLSRNYETLSEWFKNQAHS